MQPHKNLRDGDGSLPTNGFSFVEMASNNQPEMLDFLDNFNFMQVGQHSELAIIHFQQGHIHLIINFDPDSHAMQQARKKDCHVITGFGIRVNDCSKNAKQLLVSRGGQSSPNGLMNIPAIQGPGEQLLYLVDPAIERQLYEQFFQPTPTVVDDNNRVNLKVLDHITINVNQGELDHWHNFFVEVFGFDLWTDYEIKVGKTWYRFSAIMSKNSKVRLPMNEPLDNISTVAEFVANNSGGGSQHLAFQAIDIVDSVSKLRKRGIDFLTIPDTYYEMVESRMPNHGEDLEQLKKHHILIDGIKDDKGRYLLLEQIFTKMMIKPIFFEVIKRRGNRGFGDGNVTALSKSLEIDQIRRGVLKGS